MEELKYLTGSKENKRRLSVSFLATLIFHSFLFYTGLTLRPEHSIHFNEKSSLSVSVKVDISESKPEPKIERLQKNSLLKKKQKKRTKKKVSKVQEVKAVKNNAGTNSIKARYLSHARQIVNDNKKFPMVAKRLKHKGTVVYEVLIGEFGDVLKIERLEKTHSRILNSASEDVFKNVKFDPLPKELNVKSLSVIFPITYEHI